MTLWDSIQREIDEANRRAIEIIKPSEQEIERGLRVHGEAIVFDFGPPGTSNLWVLMRFPTDNLTNTDS